MNIVIPLNLKNLARQFADAGHKLYIVGGYVRNAVMGDYPTDIDIASDVPSFLLKGMLKDCRVIPVNKFLGTCVININGSSFEYTPFRTETYAPGGAHRPVSVSMAGTLQQDCKRRDFTCNALYYDITDNKILDPFGGVKDIMAKSLKAILSPEYVFERDGLRLLRMIRQSAEMGFEIEENTFKTAQNMIDKLADISAERKTIELEKILNADSKYGVKDAHYTGLKRLGELGAWKYVVPEMDDAVGVAQNPAYHKYDVYEHILQVVKNAPPQVRLAALFHDIGKSENFKKTGNMHIHAEIGAGITKQRLSQNGLKYPSQTISETVRLVRNHMYDFNGETKNGKLRMFIAKNFDIMEKLIALKKADALGAGLIDKEPEIRMESVYKEMLENNCPVRLSDLKIDGSELKALNPLIPDKDIGTLLHGLLEEVIVLPHLNEKEWLSEQVKKYVPKSEIEQPEKE